MTVEMKTPVPGRAWAIRRSLTGQLDVASRLAEVIMTHTGATVHVLADGSIHRQDHPDGRKGNSRLWYVCHPDFAVWGDWATGEQRSVFADAEPDPEMAQRARQEAERRKRDHQDQVERKRSRVARQCRMEWPGLPDADPAHAYLMTKKVKPGGLRQQRDNLVVPLYYETILANFQTIAPDGTKRFLPGGRKKGCYHPIGGLRLGVPLLICEGVATGITLHMATGYPVACAMDCGNLLPVARTLRARHPSASIIICADNDHRTEGNPGITAGQAAARAIGGRCTWPEFPEGGEGTDFNDLVGIGQEVSL